MTRPSPASRRRESSTAAAGGEAAVAVEYRGSMATAALIFLDRDPAFAWKAPPENNYIDHSCSPKLRLLRLQPSELAGDEEFLRRVSWTRSANCRRRARLACSSPTVTPAKRERLVDALLDRPEFADWWAMKWADRLGCNPALVVGKIGAVKYFSVDPRADGGKCTRARLRSKAF